MDDDFSDDRWDEPEVSGDPKMPLARGELRKIIDASPNDVFYSRQLEIMLEGKFFDWITNRALHHLIDADQVMHEERERKFNHEMLLVWNRKNRYYKRRAAYVESLVDAYSEPKFTKLLGAQGQLLFENAMGRLGFHLMAENANAWNGRQWTDSNENLDYIYQRDGIVYGVEVKNGLGKIDDAELRSKSRMCRYLEIVPFFVVCWMPKHWINQVVSSYDGFVLMLKWQLYPLSHAEFAREIKAELGLPVDAPPRYHQKTLDRILAHHEKRVKRVNSKVNSP